MSDSDCKCRIGVNKNWTLRVNSSSCKLPELQTRYERMRLLLVEALEEFESFRADPPEVAWKIKEELQPGYQTGLNGKMSKKEYRSPYDYHCVTCDEMCGLWDERLGTYSEENITRFLANHRTHVIREKKVRERDVNGKLQKVDK